MIGKKSTFSSLDKGSDKQRWPKICRLLPQPLGLPIYLAVPFLRNKQQFVHAFHSLAWNFNHLCCLGVCVLWERYLCAEQTQSEIADPVPGDCNTRPKNCLEIVHFAVLQAWKLPRVSHNSVTLVLPLSERVLAIALHVLLACLLVFPFLLCWYLPHLYFLVPSPAGRTHGNYFLFCISYCSGVCKALFGKIFIIIKEEKKKRCPKHLLLPYLYWKVDLCGG